MHTNLDNIKQGVNHKICDMLNLGNLEILAPKSGTLMKLVSFVPQEDTYKVLEELHLAGAGVIGEYDHCSFRVEGTGRFKPGEKANPHIGNKNLLEEVKEERIEVIFPAAKKNDILQALNQSHPYEEPAYYLQELANLHPEIGSGMIGDLKDGMAPEDFLEFLKKNMQLQIVKYTPVDLSLIQRVAVCGGSGSFLLTDAQAKGADALITADVKYHDFFEADGKLMIIDIGHYESEVHTKDLIFGLINKKFSNIALRLSEVNTNPVRYR
jgi:hypothetical protein